MRCYRCCDRIVRCGCWKHTGTTTNNSNASFYWNRMMMMKSWCDVITHILFCFVLFCMEKGENQGKRVAHFFMPILYCVWACRERMNSERSIGRSVVVWYVLATSSQKLSEHSNTVPYWLLCSWVGTAMAKWTCFNQKQPCVIRFRCIQYSNALGKIKYPFISNMKNYD